MKYFVTFKIAETFEWELDHEPTTNEIINKFGDTFVNHLDEDELQMQVTCEVLEENN